MLQLVAFQQNSTTCNWWLGLEYELEATSRMPKPQPKQTKRIPNTIRLQNEIYEICSSPYEPHLRGHEI